MKALIAPRIEWLAQAVADGYLTQEQADWMIEEMTEHMMWRLENLGLGHGGGYGGFGHSGCGTRGGGYHGGRQGGWGGGRWGNNTGTPRFPNRVAPSTGTSL